MPGLLKLLILTGVALLVLAIWRKFRAHRRATAAARVVTASVKRFERRERQRRMRQERRSAIRLEAERRRGHGRRVDDNLG
jgi:hypothetical protein